MEVRRAHDVDLEFFPKEVGFKEYKLFGITLYRRDFKSSTYDTSIANGKNKKDTGIGFKK